MPAGTFMYRIVAGNQPPTYQTLVLQQGSERLYRRQDTYLSQWAPDLNYGAASDIRLYHTGAQPTMKALLRFDLSQLPANAYRALRRAERARRQVCPHAGSIAVDAYRMNRPWAGAAGDLESARGRASGGRRSAPRACRAIARRRPATAAHGIRRPG